eukprot:496335_1
MSTVICQAIDSVTISYARDGDIYTQNTTDRYPVNTPIIWEVEDVMYTSNIKFTVSVPHTQFLPGLQCSIRFEQDTYNTFGGNYMYWSVVSVSGTEYTSSDIVDAISLQTILEGMTVSNISSKATWIWNHLYNNTA